MTNSEILNTLDISIDEYERLVEIEKRLASKGYEVAIEKSVSNVFNKFSSVNSQSISGEDVVFTCTKNNASVDIYFCNISEDSTNGTQCWGTILLKQDFGHVLIRPETFLDKIHSLVADVQTNFLDDKEFNKKYYFVSDNKEKTEMQFTGSFRRLISEIELDEFIIEIVGERLIIGNEKLFNERDCLAYAAFLINVSKRL